MSACPTGIRYLWRETDISRRVGACRTHQDAMRIVSGRLARPNIHLEPPRLAGLPLEMESFSPNRLRQRHQLGERSLSAAQER